MHMWWLNRCQSAEIFTKKLSLIDSFPNYADHCVNDIIEQKTVRDELALSTLFKTGNLVYFVFAAAQTPLLVHLNLSTFYVCENRAFY